MTPKRATERLLASTYVRGEWGVLSASVIWGTILARYAPQVRVLLYEPEQFRDVPGSIRCPGVPLRRVLEDIAAACGVSMSVNDRGDLVLSVPPRRVEAMRHGIWLEPDLRDGVWVTPQELSA